MSRQEWRQRWRRLVCAWKGDHVWQATAWRGSTLAKLPDADWQRYYSAYTPGYVCARCGAWREHVTLDISWDGDKLKGPMYMASAQVNMGPGALPYELVRGAEAKAPEPTP